nr:MAG TPA: protein of unknown function (DUF4177) [Caudoviricetes sp.]
MKKSILALLFLVVASISKAQDSCYVYTQLRGQYTVTKFISELQLGEKGDFIAITDDNGNKLSFNSILHALNYLCSKGWELVEFSPQTPYNAKASVSVKEQYVLIRKRMSMDEAKPYITPKEN